MQACMSVGRVLSYQPTHVGMRNGSAHKKRPGPCKLKALLTDKLWPNQPLALVSPLTVVSIIKGQLVYATSGFWLNNAWNPKGHANRGGLVYMEWDQSLNLGLGGYLVACVQKRAGQVVIDVQDSQDCSAKPS